ncbi:MAG: FeoB-associated Cys-rich membrane protein [Bacteroidota bacterium]
MNIQLIIVGIIISAAALFLIKKMIRSSKGHSCDSGNCKQAHKK